MRATRRLLLDTHILLYWLGRDPRLSVEQAGLISEATADDPLWVADISLWEIATLVSLRRLRLHTPLRDWLEAAVAPPLVRRIGISPTVAAQVAQLPDTFPRDPGDRIIVATALTLGARLLTQDERIISSALVRTVR
jgi:PIN domain nuclease of toxin-antitoxin system